MRQRSRLTTTDASLLTVASNGQLLYRWQGMLRTGERSNRPRGLQADTCRLHLAKVMGGSSAPPKKRHLPDGASEAKPLQPPSRSPRSQWSAQRRERPHGTWTCGSRIARACARAPGLSTRRRCWYGEGFSMVEEPHVGKRHGHAVGVARLDHFLIGIGAAWLRDELDAQLLGVVDGVPEREEGVRGDGDVAERGQEVALLLGREGLRRAVEVLDPLLVLCLIHVSLDVPHTRIHTVLPLHAVLELQASDLRVEAKVPSRDLPAGELDAIHPALLPGADTNHHAILGVAHRVGLRVLDRDHAQDHVQLGLLGQLLALCGDLLEALRIADLVV